MSTLSLPAVGGLEWKGGIALPAHFLIAVELFSDGGDGGIHGASSESQHQMKSGLLLDVVVRQAAAV